MSVSGAPPADRIPPRTVATPSAAPNDAGWYNRDVTVNLAATDDGGSGVKEIAYSLDGAQTGGAVVGGAAASVTVSAEGSTNLRYYTRDNAGNQEEEQVLHIQIDKTAPAVLATCAPSVLWPPNHKLYDFAATVNATDGVSGVASVVLGSVSSNEPDAGLGPDDVPGDIQGWQPGTSDTQGRLRAERAGGGEGRTYTVTHAATDRAGNSTTAGCTVRVPHDMGR